MWYMLVIMLAPWGKARAIPLCPSIVVFASPPVALLAAMELFRFESGLILSALSVSHWLG